MGLTEGLSSPKVTQIISNEKKNEYSPDIKPLEAVAQSNLTIVKK